MNFICSLTQLQSVTGWPYSMRLTDIKGWHLNRQQHLRVGSLSIGTVEQPNNSMQRTALRAAADAER
jgi:hypothetical protein